MQVFDTAALPVTDRADAVSVAMLRGHPVDPSRPSRPRRGLAPHRGAPPGNVALTHVVTSGMDTTRTRRQTAADNARSSRSAWAWPAAVSWSGTANSVVPLPPTVNLIELTEPYRSRIARGTDGWSVKIPLDSSRFPHWVIRNGLRPASPSSPVHPVFAHHLLSLARQAPRLEGGRSSALLGTATIALARALICSAAEDPRRIGRGHDRLPAAPRPDLHPGAPDRARPHPGPDRCGAPHLRAPALQDLRRRRPPARTVDHRPAPRGCPPGACPARRAGSRTIAAVARRWCFTNPSHFTQRFREAYGMTPREWQAGTEGTASGSHGTSRVSSDLTASGA